MRQSEHQGSTVQGMDRFTAVQMAWTEFYEKILDGFENSPWCNSDNEVVCAVAFVQFGFEKDSFTDISSLTFLLVYYLNTYSQTFYQESLWEILSMVSCRAHRLQWFFSIKSKNGKAWDELKSKNLLETSNKEFKK